MRRRRDLLRAVILALSLHVGLAAGAAWYVRQRPLMPEFAFGESSLQLTLVAAPPAAVPAPAEPPEPDEPLPLFEPDTLVMPVPEAPREEPVEDPAPPAVPDTVTPPAPAPAPDTRDADLHDKGVVSTEIESSSVRPRYPLGARLRGEEGLVRLTVRVNGAGAAEAVTILQSSGFSALDRAAVKAAWEARYIDSAGAVRAGETTFGVRFRLED